MIKLCYSSPSSTFIALLVVRSFLCAIWYQIIQHPTMTISTSVSSTIRDRSASSMSSVSSASSVRAALLSEASWITKIERQYRSVVQKLFLALSRGPSQILPTLRNLVRQILWEAVLNLPILLISSIKPIFSTFSLNAKPIFSTVRTKEDSRWATVRAVSRVKRRGPCLGTLFAPMRPGLMRKSVFL